uniref:Uncharacterized protein n=1 Tax=Arundo donax TaxID=35708 RepID=A0A0A9CD82_ARUDO
MIPQDKQMGTKYAKSLSGRAQKE